MKREIKFRAKQKGSDDWIYFDLQKEIENDGLLSEFMMCNLDKDTVQQFTGLYDIHGKEIYEGDTVRWGHRKGVGSEFWHRHAVVEINPDIQFRILYFINSVTGGKNDSDGHIFHYGNFAYKNTEKYLEIL